MPENPQTIKVTILLAHYRGEEMWTATVPLIEGCLAEGSSPENAVRSIQPEIDYFLTQNPQLIETLSQQPEFLLTEEAVTLPPPPPQPIQ